MSKKYADEPDDRMEAPCMCRCGNWFDLDDGCSDLDNSKTLICQECSDAQEAEAEKQEDIDDLKSSLEDAEWTVKDCKEQLKKLGVKIDEPPPLPTVEECMEYAVELGIWHGMKCAFSETALKKLIKYAQKQKS